MRYPPFIEADYPFPAFVRVRRTFPRPRLADPPAELTAALETALPGSGIKPGDSVAVGIGSRGIAGLVPLVKAVCRCLKDQGARPVIVPAMGSHGGATAEGQTALLAGLGVDGQSCGCPVNGDMETELLSQALGEVPVHFSRVALESDHTICLNRIKPHTKFKAPVESGLMKMLCVGLGKHQGALAYHLWALKHGFCNTLTAMADRVLERSNLRLAVATVENAYDDLMAVEVIPAADIPFREPELLDLAKANLARLPVETLDALIIRRVGKEISGPGMDTNVVGRAYDLQEDDFSSILKATRVAILDLSEATAGNGAGIGNADVITERVFEKLDYEKTVINCLTGCSLRKAFIPVRMPNDEKAIQTCLTTLGPVRPDDIRAVIIQDTLHLTEFWISAALWAELESREDMEAVEEISLPFDRQGDLDMEWL